MASTKIPSDIGDTPAFLRSNSAPKARIFVSSRPSLRRNTSTPIPIASSTAAHVRSRDSRRSSVQVHLSNQEELQRGVVQSKAAYHKKLEQIGKDLLHAAMSP